MDFNSGLIILSVSIWYSHNGERLGTLQGHNGAVFTVDVDPTTTVCVTGAADQTIRMWDVQTGTNICRWETKATARLVEISPSSDRFLAVTEEHMGQRGSITVYALDTSAKEQKTEPLLVISNPVGNPKVSYATWAYDGKYIIAGHADGSVSKFDAITGEQVKSVPVHDGQITDLQPSLDRTYIITSSKDKSAKLVTVDDLEVLHTYSTETPMNSAAITPIKDFVVMGGGQDAKDVTLTSSREGKFESRFHHKLFEDELGRVTGHFGPINTIAAHPRGTSFSSGGEDGYIRIHHFDKPYFDFMYEVERTAAAAAAPGAIAAAPATAEA